ncbi:MAG: hypothetical protein ACM30G_21985 [Micromonosporaceae bacterium]
MEDVRSSIAIIIAMLAIVALIAFARGAAHHRGQQVGAVGSSIAGPADSLADHADG